MKKILCIISFVGILLLTACQNDNVNILQEEVQSSEENVNTLQLEVNLLQEELEAVKQELSIVKEERDKLNTEYTAIQTKLDTMLQEKAVQEGDVTVVVVDKINVPKDTDNWVFSNRSNFHISITNNTDKEIKGIQGVLDIQDMFGVSIMESKCDLVGYTIQPSETVIDKDLGLEINEYMDDHVKLYTSEFDDLIFVYVVNKIMFSDGTMKE